MIEDKVGEYLDVKEHPEVKKWLLSLIEKPIDFFLLTQNNTDFFTEKFGIPLKNKGSKEYNKIWHIVAQDNFEIKALAGKLGSMYICKTFATRDEFKKDETLGKEIIGFLEREVIFPLKGQ